MALSSILWAHDTALQSSALVGHVEVSRYRSHPLLHGRTPQMKTARGVEPWGPPQVIGNAARRRRPGAIVAKAPVTLLVGRSQPARRMGRIID